MIISEQEKNRIRKLHGKSPINEQGFPKDGPVRAETKICIPFDEMKAAITKMSTGIAGQKEWIGEGCVNYEDFKIMFADQISMFCNPESNKDWVVTVEQTYDDDMETWR